MKTYYILALLLSTSIISIAQNIKGAVFNKETKNPLEGVHVYLKATKQGALSDSKGTFELEHHKSISRKDTIEFSFTGFKTLRISLSDLDKKEGVVYLEQSLEKLDVVNIYSERELNQSIKFTKLTPMKIGIHSFGSVMLDGKIYVMGGDSSYLVNSSLKILNDYPDIGMGELVKKMKVNYSVEKYRDEFLIYDIEQDNWEITEVKFQKRAYHNLNYYNGSYYVLGGKRIQGVKSKEYLSDKIEVYDKENNIVTIDDTNPHQAVDFSSVVYKDNLIVLGGSIRENIYGEKTYSKKIHLYNLESGLWYELEDMPKAKETRGVLIEDKLYLIGGFNQIPLKKIESLDMESGKWQEEGDMFQGVGKPAIAHDNNIIYFFEYGKIYTYDINTKELNEYLVDLYLQASTMYFSNNKLYIIGGFRDENFTTRSSRDLYSVDLSQFETTRIHRSKML